VRVQNTLVAAKGVFISTCVTEPVIVVLQQKPIVVSDILPV
jgi:hypothetical protein